MNGQPTVVANLIFLGVLIYAFNFGGRGAKAFAIAFTLYYIITVGQDFHKQDWEYRADIRTLNLKVMNMHRQLGAMLNAKAQYPKKAILPATMP